MNIKRDHGWLALRFWYNHERRVEYLNLRDTQENLPTARRKAKEVARAIVINEDGWYERLFPESRYNSRKPVTEMTLGEWADKWIDALEHELVSETAEDYRSCIRNHIKPAPLAAKLLSDIADDDINLFIGQLKTKLVNGKPLSPRRINMVVARLRTMFKKAARTRLSDGRYMIKEDPMRYVDNLRQPRTDVDPFTLEEAQALIAAAEGQFKSLLTLLIFTGLRPNEALGLKWDDIDWRQGFIKVRRTLSRLDGERLPKTSGSERDVEMIETVRRALSDQQVRTRMKQKEYVFLTERDTPMTLSNIRAREWERLLVKARVRKRPIYQCRHTFATLSLLHGDTVQHISAQMGHSTIAMVERTYSRWKMRPQGSGAGARIDAKVIGPVSTPTPVKQGEIG